MRCKKATQQLQLYIDGCLTMEQTRALEAHVALCAACREELEMLQEVAYTLHNLRLIAEPKDLKTQIMQRIATATERSTAHKFSLLRPSLLQLLAVVLLATIATFGSILAQPSLRALLPFANGHDSLSIAFMNILHLFGGINSGTLVLALWVVGTILGVCITLALAGTEMRSQWFKAMMERLPVR
jgi:predicted anti-sigma-YlaC factor YlaD